MTEETKNHLMTTTAPAPHYEEDDGLSSFHLDQMGQRVSVFQGARLMKFVSGTYITREGETIELEAGVCGPRLGEAGAEVRR